MHISARRHDKTTIFDLSGDSDFANSHEVRNSVLGERRAHRTARVVVNLSQVRYIYSSGVGPKGLRTASYFLCDFQGAALSCKTRALGSGAAGSSGSNS
jgi:hypothetical protein